VILALLFAANLWTWNASPTADGYKFCWSYDRAYWNLALCADTGPALEFPTDEMDSLWAVETNPHATMYYQAVAYNAAGLDTTGQAFAPRPASWPCALP